MDANDVDLNKLFGPDRVLPCGCHVINGAICIVTPAVGRCHGHLFAKPGRFIAVNGIPEPKENQ